MCSRCLQSNTHAGTISNCGSDLCRLIHRIWLWYCFYLRLQVLRYACCFTFPNTWFGCGRYVRNSEYNRSDTWSLVSKGKISIGTNTSRALNHNNISYRWPVLFHRIFSKLSSTEQFLLLLWMLCYDAILLFPYHFFTLVFRRHDTTAQQERRVFRTLLLQRGFTVFL